MDHLRFCHRPANNSLVEQPTEYEAAAGRGAAVESESELLQVCLQVVGCDRALVSAEDPALQQAGYPMDTRHGDVSRIPGRGQHRALSRVTVLRQVVVSAPSVGADSGTESHDGAHEWHEMVARGIGNATHPQSTETLGIEHLDGDSHHRLGATATAFAATFQAADKRLI